MQTIRVTAFLRRVLLMDAATCVAVALLLMFGARPLNDLFKLPSELLFYAGISLFPFAAFLLYLGTRERTAPPFVWAVVFLNALWAFDSLLILLAGWVEPNAFGYAFVVAQAVGVAMLAGLEYAGLKRSEVENASTAERVF